MKGISVLIGVVTFLWSQWVEGKTGIFPDMAGWKKSGQVQIFHRENLYEYIDGAADLYLMYQFEELKVMEYQNDAKAQVTIDLYRHSTALDAFGIYSQERLPKAEFLPIGLEAYYERGLLNVLNGRYYIKLSSANTGAEDRSVLIAFAERMAKALGPKGSFPAPLSAFPQKGKQRRTEKFFTKNFLGYAFFHTVYTADYQLHGQPFKIFLMEGKNTKDAQEAMKAYLQTLGHRPMELKEGRFTLLDPHHGEIDLFWQGKYLWGILNLKDPSSRFNYLKKLEEGLKKVSPSCCQ